MKSGFCAAVSAIALLSSGAVQAEPVTNSENIASITQAASSSQTTATITQTDQITTSSAIIVQDAAGSGNNRASVTITQGNAQSNSATNTAKAEQSSVTDGADILINQSGTSGGTNYANVLQSGLVGGGADIAQIANGAGVNRIGTFQLSNFQYDFGFEQQGTNTNAYIRQTTTGVLNDISGVAQSGDSKDLKIYQGNSLNSGGTNKISGVAASGNISIYQDSASSGGNELVKFSGGGTKSDLSQSASDNGSNMIGSLYTSGVDVTNNSFTVAQIATGNGTNSIGAITGVTASGGDLTINQTSSGAIYHVDLVMSGGTLTINQLSESTGQGTVTITAFSGGTGLIEQRAGSNGGNNLITVESYDTSSSSVAVLQNGGDNGISVNRGNVSSDNNSVDDGTNGEGSAATVFDLFYSRLTIEQYGTYNTANLNQNTADNVGRIYQNGTGNVATINQTLRSGSTAYMVQLGSNGNATINQ
jgi:hypothetical protein